jgi:hypothetical protein
VGVNGEDIRSHHTSYEPFPHFASLFENADHVVEVIGIIDSDSQHPLVIINDSTISGGYGIEVPAETFEHAWASSNYLMLSTTLEDL